MDDRQTALETRFDTTLPTLATKADVEALRADIHKWMVGSMIGLFIGFGGLAAALGQLLKPPPQPAPVVLPAAAAPLQPIVIYLTPPPAQK
jgi:hypothetical protein